jgi:ribonuclease PH
MNVVMTGDGRYVEIQGTAESKPFDARQMEQMLGLARVGVAQLVERQKEILGATECP